MAVKYLPVNAIVSKFDPSFDPYPERLEIKMSDGRTVSYVRDVQQPHPCFLKVMESLTRGYPKYGKHERRSEF